MKNKKDHAREYPCTALRFPLLCARPTVVQLGIAHGDVLSRESHGDGHGSLVVDVERLLVVDDVGILERNLLHLGVLLALLVDDLTLDRLELAVEHGLDSGSVVRGLDGHADAAAGDA